MTPSRPGPRGAVTGCDSDGGGGTRAPYFGSLRKFPAVPYRAVPGRPGGGLGPWPLRAPAPDSDAAGQGPQYLRSALGVTAEACAAVAGRTVSGRCHAGQAPAWHLRPPSARPLRSADCSPGRDGPTDCIAKAGCCAPGAAGSRPAAGFRGPALSAPAAVAASTMTASVRGPARGPRRRGSRCSKRHTLFHRVIDVVVS